MYWLDRKPLSRRLYIGFNCWEYRIGRNYVIIYSPHQENICVSCHKILGMSEEEYDLKRLKRLVKVTPSDVKHWIETKLVN